MPIMLPKIRDKCMLPLSAVFRSYPTEIESFAIQLESHPLLTHVQEHFGTLEVGFKKIGPRPAKWSWKDETLWLNPEFYQTASKADALAYFIFELCNATRTAQFKALERNPKGVESFVKEFERLEHHSLLETQQYMKELVGEDVHYALKDTFQDFPSHLLVQELSGHSEAIAQKAFPESDYHGTWPCPLSTISTPERQILLTMLSCHLRLMRNEKVKQHQSMIATIRKKILSHAPLSIMQRCLQFMDQTFAIK